MWPMDQIKGFITNIVLKKGLRSAIGVAVAFVTSGFIASELLKYGVTINKLELETALTVLLAGGLEAFRTWIKSKYKIPFL